MVVGRWLLVWGVGRWSGALSARARRGQRAAIAREPRSDIEAGWISRWLSGRRGTLVHEDDGQRCDRSEQQRREEPAKPAAVLRLREAGVDEREREPPDRVTLHHE